MPNTISIRRVKTQEKKFAKRTLSGQTYWPVEFSGIHAVEASMDFPIREFIKNKYAAGNNKPVVVDWGCGSGCAIQQIARQIPKAKCIGFSEKRYLEWNKHSDAEFIQAVEKDFFRYFKDNSIDFLFSHLGIEHLKNPAEYVQKIIPKLKVGGTIALMPSLEEKIRLSGIIKGQRDNPFVQENSHIQIQYLPGTILILRKN